MSDTWGGLRFLVPADLRCSSMEYAIAALGIHPNVLIVHPDDMPVAVDLQKKLGKDQTQLMVVGCPWLQKGAWMLLNTFENKAVGSPGCNT